MSDFVPDSSLKVDRTVLGINAGLALVVLSAASFGLMPVFAKLAYAEMDMPQAHQVKTLLTIRFIVAALCMWAIWLVQRKRTGELPLRRGKLSLSRLLPLVALGALGYVGQSYSYFTALGTISASATGLLLYTYPILVTILAWLFLRESMDMRKIVALSVASVGALLVLGIFSSVLGGAGLGTLNPEGVAWGLSAAGIYSLYIVAGARFTRDVSPIFSSAVIITSAGLVYLVWGLLAGDLHIDLSLQAWIWAVLIAVVCTVLSIVAFFAGLATVGPSRAAIVSTLEPAVTVALAALILHERLSLEQVGGGALILLAVYILQLQSNKH